MESYLIQRGTFKEATQYEGIDSILKWDYMGSSEFEWGALPKSLKRIIDCLRKEELEYQYITINGKRFHLVTPPIKKEDVSYIEILFNDKVENPYGGLKEMLGIDHYFEGKTKKRLKKGCVSKMEEVKNYRYCDFWWDVENDFLVFPEENMNLKKVYSALNYLKEKGFGIKEND